MSTMVLMPVRVKPPPAETGDTISPGWASLLRRHAAERRADDRVVERGLLQRHLPLGHRDLLAQRGDAGDDRVDLGLRLVHVGRGGQLLLEEPLAPAEHRACASSSRTSDSGTARRAASSWACARPSIARTVESSRRASTWPSRTAIPSSTFTSTTLPVTLDDTVARRRAVT